MKFKHLVAAALLAITVTSVAFAQSTQITGVASVIDGDTIEIHGERIRLSGIDAPERGRRCAGSVNAYQRASLALSDAIGRRTVQCQISGQDRYGRHVATCSVGGADLGDLMDKVGRVIGRSIVIADMRIRNALLNQRAGACGD